MAAGIQAGGVRPNGAMIIVQTMSGLSWRHPTNPSLHPQLRYVRHVFLAHVLRIDMVVDIHRFLDRVSPQPFHIFTPHPGPEKMGGEPVSAAVGGELCRRAFLIWDCAGR